MKAHPKQFILNWTEDLFAAFAKAERDFVRPVDRGTPRETELQALLKSFLPGRFGVTSGHIVSAKPEWSRQSDVIIYNALESPVLSRQQGHQGDILPIEGVHGMLEVKSTLTEPDFDDALEKVAQFKSLKAFGKDGELGPRFAGMFFFRLPEEIADDSSESNRLIRRCLDKAQRYDISVLPDLGIILGRANRGTHDHSAGRLIVKADTPVTKGLVFTEGGTDNSTLPTFLYLMLEGLRSVSTGFPGMFWYLFDRREVIGLESESGTPLSREAGWGELDDSVTEAIKSQFIGTKCPICSGDNWTAERDLLVVKRLKHTRLGDIPSTGMTAIGLMCNSCGYLSLHVVPKQ